MRYLSDLKKLKDVTTNEGETVEVFELSSKIDDEVFSEYTKLYNQTERIKITYLCFL